MINIQKVNQKCFLLIYPILKCQTVYWLDTPVLANFWLQTKQFILTGNWGAQSHKADGIDTVLEIDEAAKMAGDVSDNGSDNTDGSNGNDECGVSVENG